MIWKILYSYYSKNTNYTDFWWIYIKQLFKSSIQVVDKIIERSIFCWSINKITTQINKNKMNNKYKS